MEKTSKIERWSFRHSPKDFRILVIGKEKLSSSIKQASSAISLLGYQVNQVEQSSTALADLRSTPSKYAVILVSVVQGGRDSGSAVVKKLVGLGVKDPIIMIGQKDVNTSAVGHCLDGGALDVLLPPITSRLVHSRIGFYVEAKFLGRLTVQNEQKIADLESVTKEFTQLQESHASATKAIKSISAERDHAVATSHDLDTKLNLVESRRSKLQKEIIWLKEQLSSQKRGESDGLREVNDLKRKYKKLEMELISRESRTEEREWAVRSNEELTSQVEVLTKDIKQLQRSHEEHIAIQEAARRENDSLKLMNGQMTLEIQTLHGQATELRKEIKKKESVVNMKQWDIERLNQELDLACYRATMGEHERPQQMKSEAEDFLFFDKRNDILDSFNSPMQRISSTLAKVSNDPMTPAEMKIAIKGLVEKLTDSDVSDVYRPSVNKIVSSMALDPQTKRWMKRELGGETEREKLGEKQEEAAIVFYSEDLENFRNDWTFDIFKWESSTLINFVVGIFQAPDFDLMNTFDINPNTLRQFITTVRENYPNNPFHNFRHAVDVCQTCFLFLKHTPVSSLLTKLDILSLLISALCHDLQHPATNNAYQISLSTPLAIRYNDIHVLEAHHCTETFQILLNDRCNIFKSIPSDQKKELRKSIIETILSTDMAVHFELLSKFETKLHTSEFSVSKPEDRQLLLNILLHCADISNPAKPTNSRKWSDMVFDEFLRQGDLEKKNGLAVSAFFDRNDTNQGKLNLNFIDFIVFPLYSSLSGLFPSLSVCVTWLKKNRTEWDTCAKAEQSKQRKPSTPLAPAGSTPVKQTTFAIEEYLESPHFNRKRTTKKARASRLSRPGLKKSKSTSHFPSLTRDFG